MIDPPAQVKQVRKTRAGSQYEKSMRNHNIYLNAVKLMNEDVNHIIINRVILSTYDLTYEHRSKNNFHP